MAMTGSRSGSRASQGRGGKGSLGVRPSFHWLVLGIGLAILPIAGFAIYAPLRPMTGHMTLHILLMSLLAPLISAAALRSGFSRGLLGSGRTLTIAAASQIGLLWLVHSPAVMAWSMAGRLQAVILPAALFAAALAFWGSVFAQHGAERWRALVALLLTGKLFCLLAALLVFAPRHLYPAMMAGGNHVHAAAETASLLADQQLAGLLMIAACPLTYVAAAIAIAARWLEEGGSAEPVPARPADWA